MALKEHITLQAEDTEISIKNITSAQPLHLYKCSDTQSIYIGLRNNTTALLMTKDNIGQGNITIGGNTSTLQQILDDLTDYTSHYITQYDIVIGDANGNPTTVSGFKYQNGELYLNSPSKNNSGDRIVVYNNSSKKLQYRELSSLGIYSNWKLQANVGATENINSGDTVSFNDGTYLDASRSSRDITYDLKASVVTDIGKGVTAHGWGNNYISNVGLSGTNLTFTGQGSAFNSSVDLSGIIQGVSAPNTEIIYGTGASYTSSNKFRLNGSGVLELESGGTGMIGIGFGANPNDIHSISIGYNSEAKQDRSVAVGGVSVSDGIRAVALGFNAKATNNYSIALGGGVDATGAASTSIGYNSTASNTYTTAIGYNSKAAHHSSSAFGQLAETTANNQIMLGHTSATVVAPNTATIGTDDLNGFGFYVDKESGFNQKVTFKSVANDNTITKIAGLNSSDELVYRDVSTIGGSPTITENQIGYGDSNNELTSDNGFYRIEDSSATHIAPRGGVRVVDSGTQVRTSIFYNGGGYTSQGGFATFSLATVMTGQTAPLDIGSILESVAQNEDPRKPTYKAMYHINMISSRVSADGNSRSIEEYNFTAALTMVGGTPSWSILGASGGSPVVHYENPPGSYATHNIGAALGGTALLITLVNFSKTPPFSTTMCSLTFKVSQIYYDYVV